MASNDPVGTVQHMFTAFRGGDLDAVLDTIDADARWTYVGANPKPTKAELGLLCNLVNRRAGRAIL